MGVSRQELYNQIWAEPITKVAERHEVSDSFLVRVLKRLNIPRPPQGYWAKHAAGKRLPRQPELPKVKPGDELEWSRDYMPTERAPFEVPKMQDSINYQPKSTRHPLISESLQYFKNVRESETGHLKPVKKNLPDLIVTKTSLDRALKLSNEFFNSLEAHGHRVKLAPHQQYLQRQDLVLSSDGKSYPQHPGTWSPGQPTLVYVGTVALGITIYEITERITLRRVNGVDILVEKVKPDAKTWNVPIDFTYSKNVASGRLGLRIYSPYQGTTWNKGWQEDASKSLTDLFKFVIKELAEFASEVAAEAVEAENRHQQLINEMDADRTRRQIEHVEEQRQQALKTSRDELLSIIDAWSERQLINNFFRNLEAKTEQLSREEKDLISARIALAKAQLSNDDTIARLLNWKSAEEHLNSNNDPLKLSTLGLYK